MVVAHLLCELRFLTLRLSYCRSKGGLRALGAQVFAQLTGYRLIDFTDMTEAELKALPCTARHVRRRLVQALTLLSFECTHFLATCLGVNPFARPCAEELRQHAW